MRVAFVGKGGAGKSVISGTFARVLARQGRRVLAIDSDPMPGMAFSVGVEQSEQGLPDEVMEEAPEGERPRWRLRPGLSVADVVERAAVHGPDGVRFLQVGKTRTDQGPLFRSQVVFRQILDDLPNIGWDLVGDLPGGTRQAYFGWGGYAERVFVVVEPTVKGILAARRFRRMAEMKNAPVMGAVLSKAASEGDVAMVEQGTGLQVVAAVPYDEGVATADRDGRPPIEVAPAGPAVAAVESLVEHLLGLEDGR
jgi:CO dehydrogenase maturation factor